MEEGKSSSDIDSGDIVLESVAVSGDNQSVLVLDSGDKGEGSGDDDCVILGHNFNCLRIPPLVVEEVLPKCEKWEDFLCWEEEMMVVSRKAEKELHKALSVPSQHGGGWQADFNDNFDLGDSPKKKKSRKEKSKRSRSQRRNDGEGEKISNKSKKSKRHKSEKRHRSDENPKLEESVKSCTSKDAQDIAGTSKGERDENKSEFGDRKRADEESVYGGKKKADRGCLQGETSSGTSDLQEKVQPQSVVLGNDVEENIGVELDVPLSKQLAFSSEGEEEEEEEENLTGEAGGEYWMRMATAGTSHFKDLDNGGTGGKEGEVVDHPKSEVLGDQNIDDKGGEDELLLECQENDLFSDEDEDIHTPAKPAELVDMVKEEEGESTGFDVFSLGNYCPATLAGELCSQRRCGWVHYMSSEDAVNQFYRIMANKPTEFTIAFARFCINLEVQERLEEDARELLGFTDQEDACYWVDKEEDELENHRDVSRVVFKEILKTSQGELPLDASFVLDLIELSSDLFPSLDQCLEVMVPLLQRASSVMTEEADKAVVVRWAWTSVYQPNLEKGVVLPQKFHDHMCNLLAASQETFLQLAEALLYCSLVPSLVPRLECLHTLLYSAEALKEDTALFAAKCLANLRDDDWRAMRIQEVLPSLNWLAAYLVDERPEDVAKFYSGLPEVDGLQVPDIPAFPESPEKLLIGKWVETEAWQKIVEMFFSKTASDVVELVELTEHLVEEVERVAESGCLKIGLPNLLHFFVAQGQGRASHIHWLLLGQLGLAFMVLLVRGNFWEEANHVLAQLSGPLAIDFTSIKLPAIGIFLDLSQELMPLFVLEVQVRGRLPTSNIIARLEQWDFLDWMVNTSVRDRTLQLVIARLLDSSEDVDLQLKPLSRLVHLITPTMAVEEQALSRRKQELLMNNVLRRWLNMSNDGTELWALYQAAETCKHCLSQEVARGLVYSLTHARMLPEATQVYRSAMSWGMYPRQMAASSPPKLLVNSSHSMEEMCVITIDFLAKLNIVTSEDLRVNIEVQEGDTSKVRNMRHLACVPCGKEEGVIRLQRMLADLEPPLAMSTKGGITFLQDMMVRRYLEARL